MTDWVARTAQGDKRALARLCRLLDESSGAAGVALQRQLYRALLRRPRGGWSLGITGSPGAGKSTLVAALLGRLRKRGLRCAVVAIDPSSPFSGGALLGDRIRMQQHFGDTEVFIRSVATRGALGGLSRSTFDLVAACELWGADVVLIETVGVGQDELDVIGAADTTCVVFAPGMGDDVQANKAGIVEVADVFAVNKADLSGAKRVVSDLQATLALGKVKLGPARLLGHGSAGHGSAVGTAASSSVDSASWDPPIIECAAERGTGVEQLLEELERHRTWLRDSEAGQQRARERAELRAQRRLLDAIVVAVQSHHSELLEQLAKRVALGEIDPASAAERLRKTLGIDR